jgi:hypothetical protein
VFRGPSGQDQLYGEAEPAAKGLIHDFGIVRELIWMISTLVHSRVREVGGGAKKGRTGVRFRR